MSKSKSPTSRRPTNTPFRQQRLMAWTPVYGSGGTIFCLVASAIFLLPMGAVILVASRDTQVVEFRYDNHEDLLDCPWVKGAPNERCFDFPCREEDGFECSRQSSCGMIANLAPHCPRKLENLQPDDIRKLDNCDPHCTASVNFTVTETIDGPVYMYYKIEEMWQNHRKYVDGRSEAQLAGKSATTGDCPPYLRPAARSNNTWCQEMTKTDNDSGLHCNALPFEHGNVKVVGALNYAPCGLSAWSMFNDSFTLTSVEDNQVICNGENPSANCTRTGISWTSDRDHRYRAPHVSDSTFMHGGFKDKIEAFWSGADAPSNESSVTRLENITVPYLYHGWYLFEPYHRIPNQLDEDLMVWNKVALLKTFHKLYRKIDQSIPPGTYRVDIKHRFNVRLFEGRKSFVLRNAKWTGAKHDFIGILMLCLGSLDFCLAVGFIIHYLCYNKAREETLEKWNEVMKTRSLQHRIPVADDEMSEVKGNERA